MKNLRGLFICSIILNYFYSIEGENQKFQDQLKHTQEKYMVLLQSHEDLNLSHSSY